MLLLDMEKLNDIFNNNRLFLFLGFGSLTLLVVLGSVYIGIQIGKRQIIPTQEVILIPTVTPSLTAKVEDIESELKPTKTVIQQNVTNTPSKSAAKIPIMSTEGWKEVKNGGVYFKIPANATCNNDASCSEVTYPNIYQGKTLLPARILVDVSDYQGGSRRTQYLKNNESILDCKPIYVESKFGNVEALQIAVDGGWCQGGYDGAIVAVIGKKFITIGPGLNYNDRYTINRWVERDTLVSTLFYK